ncbi:MAG: lytic transglycosylase domain-containing protein [Sporomusaceae bacterium]|nr:lytic transglycosylase domain-containing protein [Sporomusaceae bacterium]
MRKRLLILWYAVLILLVCEAITYGLTGYVADGYRTLAVDRFNENSLSPHDVDKKIPYAELINRYARELEINPQVVASVIQAESSFQPRAVSTAGAYGLMQVMPGTWRQVNKELALCAGRHSGECSSECYYNADLNIHIGTAYLSQLLKKYQGNMMLALAAYNAGPGAVDRYKGIPPYTETINYTESVAAHWYRLQNGKMPYPASTAKQWDEAHKVIGWCFITTVFVAIWIVWRLFRYQSSWCWR